MITRITIISESTGPIFAFFSPYESVLGIYMIDLDLFFDVSRDVAIKERGRNLAILILKYSMAIL